MNSQFSILNSQFFRLVLVMFFSLVFVGLVNAQGGVTAPTGNTGSGVTSPTGTSPKPASSGSGMFTLQNPLNPKIDSIGKLLQSFIEIFTYLVIIFAVLMLIWTGFQYVVASSQGNAKKIEELHKQLMWLVVGIAIVIGARVIVEVVINTLSATGAISPGVIDSANKAVQGK